MVTNQLLRRIRPGDCIVDFSCGSNEFIDMMENKIDQGPYAGSVSYAGYDILPPVIHRHFQLSSWFDVRGQGQHGTNVVLGLNPPFGVKNSLAIQFIEHGIQQFLPVLIVLIVPPDTQLPTTDRNQGRYKWINPRTGRKENCEEYEIVWEDTNVLDGTSFYLPGSVGEQKRHNKYGRSYENADEHGRLLDWNKITAGFFILQRKGTPARNEDLPLPPPSDILPQRDAPMPLPQRDAPMSPPPAPDRSEMPLEAMLPRGSNPGAPICLIDSEGEEEDKDPAMQFVSRHLQTSEPSMLERGSAGDMQEPAGGHRIPHAEHLSGHPSMGYSQPVPGYGHPAGGYAMAPGGYSQAPVGYGWLPGGEGQASGYTMPGHMRSSVAHAPMGHFNPNALHNPMYGAGPSMQPIQGPGLQPPPSSQSHMDPPGSPGMFFGNHFFQ
ncbi:hypothetical protein CYMTET_41703 [Cymbomonas tetramitiformis]|uniref:DM2 domain-containing protein n=1 Tax=Cymbomonas tetramitiformis TaxID=36881 RepID=A0AAE0C5P1_9CHLO|nr:hypothetical protein CYMTET_41703 [Cymbomonas tetramitiformis]